MTEGLARFPALDSLSILGALRMSGARLEQLRRERLEGALRSCSFAPFWAHRLRDAGVTPAEVSSGKQALDVLHALPPVSKRELQDARDSAVANAQIDPSWRSSISSGSTGEPLRVYYDWPAWMILKYLVKYRARAACGLRPNHRVVLLDTIAPEDEGRSLLERLGRVRRVSVFRPREEIVVQLTDFAPDWVYGLPSVLVDTAELASMQPHVHRPRAVFTSGEILPQSTRALIQEAFGCRVFDVYGSTETKEMAWECTEGSMHLNVDVVLVEVLDDQDKPVPAGTEGHIVATVLVNRAMPLIRYRTGDRGILFEQSCACGVALPTLGVVTGREVDILRLDGDRRVSPYAVTCALEQIESLRRYQVIQVGRTRLRVRALVEPGASLDATEDNITAALEGATGRPLTVTVEFVDRIALEIGKKFRVVEGMHEH